MTVCLIQLSGPEGAYSLFFENIWVTGCPRSVGLSGFENQILSEPKIRFLRGAT